LAEDQISVAQLFDLIEDVVVFKHCYWPKVPQQLKETAVVATGDGAGPWSRHFLCMCSVFLEHHEAMACAVWLTASPYS